MRVYISQFVRMDTPEEDESNCESVSEKQVLYLLTIFPDAGIQFNIPGGRSATAEYIVELMGAEYGIGSAIAKEAFSLWMISGLLGLSTEFFKQKKRFTLPITEELSLSHM